MGPQKKWTEGGSDKKMQKRETSGQEELIHTKRAGLSRKKGNKEPETRIRQEKKKKTDGQTGAQMSDQGRP